MNIKNIIKLTKQLKSDTIISIRVINEACFPHIQGKFCHFTQNNINLISGGGCQSEAVVRAEDRKEGRAEGHQTGFAKGQQAGLTEGRRTIVRNMLLRGMSDEDIIAIAECDQEFINRIRFTL